MNEHGREVVEVTEKRGGVGVSQVGRDAFRSEVTSDRVEMVYSEPIRAVSGERERRMTYRQLRVVAQRPSSDSHPNSHNS